MNYDLYEELEKTCERVTKELHDFNKRLEKNEAMISPQDLDNLFKLADIAKDVVSTKKKIVEMESYDRNQNGYSEGFYTSPEWDRRYSGNSYRGTYTMNTGSRMNDNYSGRHNYSYGMPNDDINSKLEMAMKNARDNSEMEAIRKAMEIANR